MCTRTHVSDCSDTCCTHHHLFCPSFISNVSMEFVFENRKIHTSPSIHHSRSQPSPSQTFITLGRNRRRRNRCHRLHRRFIRLPSPPHSPLHPPLPLPPPLSPPLSPKSAVASADSRLGQLRTHLPIFLVSSF